MIDLNMKHTPSGLIYYVSTYSTIEARDREKWRAIVQDQSLALRGGGVKRSTVVVVVVAPRKQADLACEWKVYIKLESIGR